MLIKQEGQLDGVDRFVTWAKSASAAPFLLSGFQLRSKDVNSLPALIRAPMGLLPLPACI